MWFMLKYLQMSNVVNAKNKAAIINLLEAFMSVADSRILDQNTILQQTNTIISAICDKR